MGRILGIDYGEVRIGLALTDSNRIIASAYGFIDCRKEDPLQRIEEIFTEKECDEVVLGLPLNLQGQDTQKTLEVRGFAKRLEEKLCQKVNFWDEGLSTKQAHKIMHQSGKKPSKNKGKVDALSAQIILQEYLQSL